MSTIVRMQGVTKDYGQGDIIVHALRGVDLELGAGEFTAIAGPSGSGKTTLLNQQLSQLSFDTYNFGGWPGY